MFMEMAMPILKTMFTQRFKISEERLAICHKCEHFEKDGARCKKCGCFMDYKTLMHHAECPIGKWHKYDKDKPLEEN